MLPVVILAGGLATRLQPLTQSIPKALISINGRPFIDHQLRFLKNQNITKVILCIGHLGEQIQDYVNDGSAFGLQVTYSVDGPKLLGTGGAIQKALPLLGENFFVQYGDSYLPVQYGPIQEFFFRSQQPALMTVFRNQNQWDTSNVIFEKESIINYDKTNLVKEMQFIDYGLGILNKEVFSLYTTNVFLDLATVYNQLSKQKLLAGFEVFERFYEIGSHVGIAEAERFLSQLNLGE